MKSDFLFLFYRITKQTNDEFDVPMTVTLVTASSAGKTLDHRVKRKDIYIYMSMH